MTKAVAVIGYSLVTKTHWVPDTPSNPSNQYSTLYFDTTGQYIDYSVICSQPVKAWNNQLHQFIVGYMLNWAADAPLNIHVRS